jgi:hypothetical protein
VVSSADHEGVVRVAGDLRDDIERVTGVRPVLLQDGVPRQREVAIVGTIGRSPLIDGLIAAGKLDVRGVQGKWETSLQTVVEHPMPGVDRAFVIAGSDQRGTIFGAYDVSRGIGVSPWYWWDDVAPRHRDALYVRRGRHTQGTPAVKYRGIFINDENPALGTWAPAFFGPGPRFRGRFQRGLLRQGLRGDAPAQGQLPVAGGLGPGVRRGRPAEPRHGQGVRHRHGHLPRGADDARHRGVEPARRPRGAR